MSTPVSVHGPTTASVLRQFYALTKPRVVQLIVFCALIGMVLAVPGVPGLAELQQGALACIGIWLVAGAAAAFNCLVEKGIDLRCGINITQIERLDHASLIVDLLHHN